MSNFLVEPTISRKPKDIKAEDLNITEVSRLGLAFKALKHPKGIINLMKDGNQAMVNDLFADISRSNDYPDILFLKNGVGGKPVAIALSTDAFKFLASQGSVDKGTTNVAFMLGGDNAADAVMGNADENYEVMSDIIKNYITIADNTLKSNPQIVSRMMSEGSEIFSEFLEGYDSHKMNMLTGSLILGIIFPNTEWPLEKVVKFMGDYSSIMDLSNSLFLKTKISPINEEVQGDISILRSRIKDILQPLFDEDKLEVEAGSEKIGLYTALRHGLEKSVDMNMDGREDFMEDSIRVTLSNLLTASYETISSALDEFIYIIANNKILPNDDLLEFMTGKYNNKKYKRGQYGKALWDYINYLGNSLKTNPSDKEVLKKYRTLITNIIYEIVRIRTPLSLALRETVNGEVDLGKDSNGHDVILPQGSLIVYSHATPTHDERAFPHPDFLRMDLTAEQKEISRSAWSVNPMISKIEEVFDRFCKGFNYSITAMQFIINVLTEVFSEVEMTQDADKGMEGTMNRKGFKSKLYPRKTGI